MQLYVMKFVWLAAGWWFFRGTPVSSTNKTDRYDITEILLKVALNTFKQTNNIQTWLKSVIVWYINGVCDLIGWKTVRLYKSKCCQQLVNNSCLWGSVDLKVESNRSMISSGLLTMMTWHDLRLVTIYVELSGYAIMLITVI